MDAPAKSSGGGQRPSAPRIARWQLCLGLLCLVMLAVTGVFAYRVVRAESLRQLEASCRDAYNRQDWPAVVKHAEAWRLKDPAAGLPLIFLAEASQTAGDFPQAAEYLSEAPKSDLKLWVHSQMELSLLYNGALNKPIEGAAVCERVLEEVPYHQEARQRLIIFYAMSLQRAKMIAEIRNAIENGTDQPRHYTQLMASQSLAYANGPETNLRWIEGDPDNELFHVARAMHLVMSGIVGNVEREQELAVPPSQDPDQQDAGPRGVSPVIREQYHEKVLKDYLQKYPQNLELLSYFLTKATDNGEVERVAELLNQLPEEAERDGRFWRYRGWLLASQERYPEAEQACRQALALNPYDYLARSALAEVYRELQRPKELKWMQETSVEGKRMTQALLALPTDRDVPGEMLLRMAQYAKMCGDQQASATLFRRISESQSASSLPGL